MAKKNGQKRWYKGQGTFISKQSLETISKFFGHIMYIPGFYNPNMYEKFPSQHAMEWHACISYEMYVCRNGKFDTLYVVETS